ncbi:MAG: hypothetical protein J7M14_01695 [Planctomycetes bacterium]|nr:hypothetical protein [Planctomycetota bacterium]
MKLSCSYEFKPKKPTCNTSYICSAFGIDFEAGLNVIARDVEVDYEPGRIVLFVGPSGSGKSSLLRQALAQAPHAIVLNEKPSGSSALIDTLGGDVRRAAHLLSLCGLGEAFLMLRSADELSDGQRYRYAIALCLAAGAKTVVADEWCAKLDRVTAKVVSRNARKLATSRGVGFLLATTHEDIIDDLQSDTVVRCKGGGRVEVRKHRPFRQPVSFCRRLEITEGAASDWPYFARWHYRGLGLAPVRRVLMLWHDEEPIGICVFTFGPLASRERNRLFGISGPLTASRARRINRNFASVGRLVLDPRYRGAGIAAAFLRRCCELTDWPWIELVSEMAHLVPFHEAAGFRTIAKTPPKPSTATPADAGRSPWGKSGWTPQAFEKYSRRVRFSRPVYCIYDNRRRQELAGCTRT